MRNPSKILSFLILLLLNSAVAFGQTATVKFEVRIPSEGLLKDSAVFLVGSFNGWSLHDSLYIMQNTGDNLYSLSVPLFDGKRYEYKYTQGDWNSVEKSSDGSEIKNRQMVSHDGLTILDTVLKWKSPETVKPKDSAFTFTKQQLNEMSKLKDEMGKKMESRMKNITAEFKKMLVNMLSDKPNMKLRKKYHNEVVSSLNYVLQMAADAIWKISSMMTPEQKKAILNQLNNSDAQGDVFGLFMNALNPPQK